MSKDINFSQEARKGLMRGINVVADSVACTMGAMGRNVVIEKPAPALPHVTKDGYSVAKEVWLDDRLANMGAQMIKGVSAKTVKDTGDGTTTATVLAQEMIAEGMAYLDKGSNPVDLKRGIDEAVALVVKELALMSKPVNGTEQTRQVATISANGDAEIGNIVEDAISRVTKEGTITVEESKSVDTYVDVVEGLKFSRGFTSSGFINNEAKSTVELDNPLILLTTAKIEAVTDIIKVLECIPESKPIFIIAGDLSGESVATLVINKIRGGWKVAAIKAPFLGEKRNYTMEDLAVITGGTVVTEAAGLTFEEFTFEMFGCCDRIVVDKDDTIIIGGHGEVADIEELKANLRSNIDTSNSPYEIEEIKQRLALISGGVAVLYVGANSEIEMKEKKDRIDDALGATRAALEEGIISGGGIALLNCAESLYSLTSPNKDIRSGYLIVKNALEKPFKVILQNAGVSFDTVITDLSTSPIGTGYDVTTNKLVDMVESGIIDPTKVTRVALENAASVASLVLMTECTIVALDK